MCYVRPAKPQISLRICAVWSEPLLVALLFYDSLADRTSFGVYKLKRRLHMLVWLYTCQNATLYEITCCSSIITHSLQGVINTGADQTLAYTINVLFQSDCRPLFCPPGEFRGVCQCVKLMTNITGMRMFLRLKVEPQAGQTLPSTEAKRRKMRLALRKILTTTSKGNDVDIYATFTSTNSSRPYHFVIATITSTPGNDIKEATLSYDVASGSEITPCNKICKPLVVYRFTGNVITSITTLRTWWQNHNVLKPEMRFQSCCHMINRI